MAVRFSVLHAGHCFAPQKHYFFVSGTNLCWRLSKSQCLVRPEWLGKLIKIIHIIRSLTRDLQVVATRLNHYATTYPPIPRELSSSELCASETPLFSPCAQGSAGKPDAWPHGTPPVSLPGHVCVFVPIVAKQRLREHVPTATNKSKITVEGVLFYAVPFISKRSRFVMYISLSLLGNGWVHTIPRQRGTVSVVVFYAIPVYQRKIGD
jgi:hypothetical protein